MEEIVKSIKTKKGATVSLIKPDKGQPFFRYEAGNSALTDSFRYVIRQHGQEDTATVNIRVELPDEPNNDASGFNKQLNGFLDCVSKFMDGSKGVTALINLMGFEEADPLNDDWVQEVFSTFNYLEYINKGGHFELKQHLGTYTYMTGEGYWHFEPGDKVMALHFPSGPDVGKNDVEWLVEAVDTEPWETEEGLYHLPVNLASQYSIGGERYGAIRARNIQYLPGTTIPIAMELKILATPYKLLLQLTNESEKEFYLRLSLADDDGCMAEIDTAIQVNQDLREPVKNENLTVSHGVVNFNNLSFTNLGSFWEAVKQDLQNQDELDKLMAVECLLDGKKIGDIRYVLANEAIEIVYLDGTSQNISDVLEEHFKKYFDEPKADGSARNTAFNLSAANPQKATFRTAASMSAVARKASKQFNQAINVRSARKPFDIAALWDKILWLFKVQDQGGIESPGVDFPGTKPDTGIFIPDTPGFDPGIIDIPGLKDPKKPGVIGTPGVIDPGVFNPDIIKEPPVRDPFPGGVIGPDPGIIKDIPTPGIPDKGTIKPADPGVIKDPGGILDKEIVKDPGLTRAPGGLAGKETIKPAAKTPRATAKPAAGAGIARADAGIARSAKKVTPAKATAKKATPKAAAKPTAAKATTAKKTTAKAKTAKKVTPAKATSAKARTARKAGPKKPGTGK